MDDTCIIVTGGEPPSPSVRGWLPTASWVIAADSGLDHAETLGLPVDLVLGDLDSVSKEALARARAAGIAVEEHPAAKDQTDLELALDRAMERGARRIVVVTGGGGRLDHLLAGAMALAVPPAFGVTVEAWIGRAWLGVVHGPGSLEVEARPGELLTLLPAGGPAAGVRTAGLRYPLHGEVLAAGSSRGVSNEMLVSRAGVSLEAGALLVIRPEALEVPS